MTNSEGCEEVDSDSRRQGRVHWADVNGYRGARVASSLSAEEELVAWHVAFEDDLDEDEMSFASADEHKDLP